MLRVHHRPRRIRLFNDASEDMGDRRSYHKPFEVQLSRTIECDISGEYWVGLHIALVDIEAITPEESFDENTSRRKKANCEDAGRGHWAGECGDQIRRKDINSRLSRAASSKELLPR